MKLDFCFWASACMLAGILTAAHYRCGLSLRAAVLWSMAGGACLALIRILREEGGR